MITFYDNQGKTNDRYTMVIKYGNHYDLYYFNSAPLSPMGINQFGGTSKNLNRRTLGKEIDFDDMPSDVQKAISQRLYPEN